MPDPLGILTAQKNDTATQDADPLGILKKKSSGTNVSNNGGSETSQSAYPSASLLTSAGGNVVAPAIPEGNPLGDGDNVYFKKKFVGLRPTAEGMKAERIYEDPLGVGVLQVAGKGKIAEAVKADKKNTTITPTDLPPQAIKVGKSKKEDDVSSQWRSGSAGAVVYNTFVDLLAKGTGGLVQMGEDANSFIQPDIDPSTVQWGKPTDDSPVLVQEAISNTLRSPLATKEEQAAWSHFDATDGISLRDVQALAVQAPSQLANMVAGAYTLGANYFLQSVGESAEELSKLPEAEKLSPLQRMGYVYTNATVQMALERLGIEKILKGTGASSAVRSRIANEITEEFITKGVKTTATEIEQAAFSKVSSLASKIKNIGVKAATGFTAEATTEGVQSMGADALKLLTNKISGSEVFDSQDIAANFAKNAINGSIQGGLFGSAFGAGHGVMVNTNKAIRDGIAKSQTPEDIAALQQQINEQVELGNITPAEASAANIKVEQYAEMAAKIPTEVGETKKYALIGGIEQREAIKQDMERVQSEMINLDPAFHAEKATQLSLLGAKLGQVNDYLEEIVSGEKTTYVEREGKYFKVTPNGEMEIKKGHYDLATQTNDIIATISKASVIMPDENTATEVTTIAPQEVASEEPASGAAVILPANNNSPDIIPVGNEQAAEIQGDNMVSNSDGQSNATDATESTRQEGNLETDSESTQSSEQLIDVEQKGDKEGVGNLNLKGEVRELWEMPMGNGDTDIQTGDLGVTEKGEIGSAVNINSVQSKMIKDALDAGDYERAINGGRMSAGYAKRIIESAGLEVPQDIVIDAGLQSQSSTKAVIEAYPKGERAVEEGTNDSDKEDFRDTLGHLVAEPNKGRADMFIGKEEEVEVLPSAFTYTTRGTNKNTYDVNVKVLKSKNGTRYIAEDADGDIVAGAWVDNNNKLTGILTAFGSENVGIGTKLYNTILSHNSKITPDGVVSKQGRRLIERAKKQTDVRSSSEQRTEGSDAEVAGLSEGSAGLINSAARGNNESNGSNNSGSPKPNQGALVERSVASKATTELPKVDNQKTTPTVEANTTKPNTVTNKTDNDVTISQQGSGSVDVRQQASDGKKMAEGNEVNKTPTQESKKKEVTKKDTVAKNLATNGQKKAMADWLREKKLKGGTMSTLDFGVTRVIVNEALDRMASAIERGTKLGNAIAAAMKWIDEKAGTKKWDKAGFAKHVSDLYTIKINGEDQLVMRDDTSETAEVINGFYSPLEQRILEVKDSVLPASEWLKRLNTEEAKWTGVADFLTSKGKEKVSKDELKNFMRDNRIEIVEVVKGSISESQIKERDDLQKQINDVGAQKTLALLNNDKQKRNELELKEKELFEKFNALSGNTNRGVTKYESYQLAGNIEPNSYREVLVTLPNRAVADLNQSDIKAAEQNLREVESEYGRDSREYRKAFESLELRKEREQSIANKKEGTYISSHWDGTPNILVHLRMSNRIDAEGNKVLHLSELQSDWGQQGKKDGFVSDYAVRNKKGVQGISDIQDAYFKKYNVSKGTHFEKMSALDRAMTADDRINYEAEVENFNSNKDKPYEVYDKSTGRTVNSFSTRNQADGHLQILASEPRVSAAPFVMDTNSWTKLGFKYAIREAVKDDAKRITWENGEQQNDRYDLSKYIDSVLSYRKIGEDNYALFATRNGEAVLDGKPMTLKQVEDTVGKEVATKIQNGEGEKNGVFRNLSGEQLRVGGKGMIGFYGSPSEGKEGIIGGVAKALIKELTGVDGKIVDTKIDVAPKNDWEKRQEYVGELPSVEQLKELHEVANKGGRDMFVSPITGEEQMFAVNRVANATALRYAIKDIEGGMSTEQAIRDRGVDVGLFGGKWKPIDESKTTTQHSIEITPELKASVEQGMPLFGEAKSQDMVKRVAEKVRSLKSPADRLQSNLFGIPIAIYDGALETIASSIEAGNAIAQAIKKGVDYIKVNYKKAVDEKGFTEFIDGQIDNFKKSLTSQTQIEQDAKDIIAGKKVFERFSQAEQRGFAEGGKNYVEATLILGRNEGASGQPETQEQEIEALAKEKDIWFDNTDIDFRKQYGKPLSELETDGNQEATVWRKDSNTVIKTQNTAMYGYDLQNKLDGITLHNTYFPEAPLKVVGFGRDKNGDFQVIVEQTFIKGSKLTPEEIKAYLNKIGFEKELDNNQYTDAANSTIVEDIHTGNAIKTPEGNIVVIDPIMRLNTPEQGYGGTREIGNDVTPLPKSLADKIRQLAQDIKDGKVAGFGKGMEGVQQQGFGGSAFNDMIGEALIIFADAIDAGVEFAKAVDEGFKTVKDYYDKNTKSYNADKVREQFEAEAKKVYDEYRSETGDDKLSGIRLAATEETRNELGLGDYEKQKISDSELDAMAEAAIKDGYNIEALLSRMETVDGGNPSSTETIILKKYKAVLDARVARNPSDENIALLKRLVRANDVARSDIGRALRAGRGDIPRDETLGDFFVTETESAGTDILTDEQKAKVTAEYEVIKEATKEFERVKRELKDANAKLKARGTIQNMKRTYKKKNKSHDEFVKERQSIADSIKEKWKNAANDNTLTAVPIPYAKQLYAIAPDVAKLTRSLVEEGVINLADVIDNVHDILKDSITEITKRDVQDLIAGQYNQQKTKNELAAKVKDLRDEAALLNQLEALENGEVPKAEKSKVQRNQKITELQKKIKDVREKIRREDKEANAFYREEISPEGSKYKATITRNQKEAERIQKLIDEGNYAPDVRPTSLMEDKELKKNFPELYKDALASKDKLIKVKLDREIRLMQQEYENRTKMQKIKDFALEVLNVPRTIMSSMDFSAPLRQGVIPTISHPRLAASAFVEMFKQAVSQKRFDRWFYDIRQDPDFAIAEKSGLYIADPHDPKLSAKEERFMNNLAERIPIIGKMIKGSERAYIAYLNKMRWDLFKQGEVVLVSRGMTIDNSERDFKALASWVNNATGRGGLVKPIDSMAPILNTAFFSPRLIASRLNLLNPIYYYNLPAPIRKMALGDMAKFATFGMSVLALTSLAMGDDDEDAIETDWRSSDFGKIRSGDTRYDIWGGFQQYIRFAGQLLTGEAKSTTSGKIRKIDGSGYFGETRWDLISRFFRGKFSPVFATAADLLTTRTVMGEKIVYTFDNEGKPNKKEITIKDEALKILAPLVFQDTYEALEKEGAKSLFTNWLPATFGIGVQTYSKSK